MGCSDVHTVKSAEGEIERWGLCPQTPEVYRFGFPDRAAGTGALGSLSWGRCEAIGATKKSDAETPLCLIKPREPLRSLLSVALSCITGKSILIIAWRETECQCRAFVSRKNYR